MAEGTPKKPSITFGNEVCNINVSEPGSATKADGAQVRLPGFVVDAVLVSTAAGGTGDVSVSGNTSTGIAARVQIATAQNAAHAQNQALAALGTIDTEGSQAALAAQKSDTVVCTLRNTGRAISSTKFSSSKYT